MPTLLKNQGAKSRNPQILQGNESNVYINKNEYFFYSNNPEALYSQHMADNGKYLNCVTVSGNGQIYTWHSNQTGQSIKNCILIYNPNSYAVQVKVTNYGLTDDATQTHSDADAWESYYNGQNTSVTVAAGGFANLFLRTIGNNHHFGIVARANIVRSGTSTSASVTLYDLAYFTNSGSANSFATAEPLSKKRARGKGSGFYTTIQFPQLSPTNTDGVGYTIASKYVAAVPDTYNDSFNGVDCSYITDPSGSTTGYLQGAFGQQFQITIPIKNTTGVARKFRIIIGSRGGKAFPFVNYNGGFAKYDPAIDKMTYVDVIETDTIPNNGMTTITFSTLVTAMSSSPYFIGVRTI